MCDKPNRFGKDLKAQLCNMEKGSFKSLVGRYTAGVVCSQNSQRHWHLRSTYTAENDMGGKERPNAA